MTAGMTIDTREFDAALIQYAAASNKDFAWASNKNLQEAVIRSIKFTKRGNKGDIEQLSQEKELAWWMAWKKLRKGAQSKSFVKVGKVKVFGTMGKTEAYESAVTGILRRRARFGFLNAYFKAASAALSKYTGNKIASAGKLASNMLTSVMPATNNNPTASLSVAYNYTKHDEKSAKQAESLLYYALQMGVNDATANMLTYVERKMNETARLFSAR